jgi:aminoglycoside phosphotransferase (APT) family kinase protein
MTATALLDAPSVARLAQVDPALVALPDALASARPGWSLHDIRWTPGRGCRLAYLVDEGDSVSFMAVRVDPAGWSQYDYREDPALPGLAAAAQDAVVAQRLGPALGLPVQGTRVTPVRYRPGSRCVMRCDLMTGVRATTVYAKVLRPQAYPEQARVLTAVATRPSGTRLVPELIATWPESQTLLTRGVPGRSLSSVLGDPSVNADARVRLAHRLGDLAARFHAQADLAVPSWTPELHWTHVSLATEAARLVDEESWQRLRQVMETLADGRHALAALAPSHGSLRGGQAVVASDGRIVLLDIDKVSLCQRERDLGSVLAHLTWQEIRQPTQARVLRRAAEGLISGYEHRAGAVDRERLAWWHAACLVQVAARRYRRLEVQDWPALAQLAHAAQEIAGSQTRSNGSGSAAGLPDPRQMAEALPPGLFSVASPGSVQVELADELATAAGRRTSVRFLVQREGRAEPLAVVAKAFSDAPRATLLWTHLRLLHAGPFGTGPLRVPEPLALLPGPRMVLYRAFDGVPLNRLEADTEVREGVRAAARWLAALHGSGLRLPRRLSLEQEKRSVRQWAESVARAAPGSGVRARALAEEWRRCAVAAPVGEVPIHKDFHAGHVLLGEGVCVIDLDEARLGDPAFDLAHFVAYLAVDFGRDAEELRELFLDEYVALSGWQDAGTWRLFAAYTWLKIAKQWAVGSGPGRGQPPERRLAGVDDALERGAGCLIG